MGPGYQVSQFCFIWYCKTVWLVGQVKQDKPVGPVSLTSSPQLLPASSGGQHCWPVLRYLVSHATLHQCSQPPVQHEYCSYWSQQEGGCILWFSGLEGWGSWEGWVYLGVENESPRRRKRTLDRGFLTGSCPCSRWCICGGVLLLTQMCLQASWGLTHTREGQEGNVWIKGEGETENYKGHKLYPWLLHIFLHYNDPISLYFNARKDVVSMSSYAWMQWTILISAPIMSSNSLYMCVHVCMYTVHCTMCHIQCM